MQGLYDRDKYGISKFFILVYMFLLMYNERCVNHFYY